MRFAFIVSCALTVACGAARVPDPAAWNASVDSLKARVDNYRDQAPTLGGAARCDLAMQQYVTSMQPMLRQLASMSGAMDTCMAQMGHQSDADLQQDCNGMDAELARYAREGCASESPAQNEVDAEFHCGRMLDYLDASAARARDIYGTMDGGMKSGWMMGSPACTEGG